MFRFSWYSVPTGIASIGFLFLAIFIYLKNRKSQVNILFSVFNLMCFFWLFAYTVCYSTQSDKVAYVFARIACTSVFLIAPFWYHFTVAFLKLEKERKYVRWVWIFVALFLPLFVFTRYFLDASKHYWGYYSKAGPLHPLSLVIWYFVCFRVLWLLLKNYLKKDLSFLERGQTKYMLAAYLCAAICSLDYIQKYGLWEIYPFGWTFAIPMSLFMTYAVIRYRMLEIDTVIHRTLLWILTLVLLVLPVALLKVLARYPLIQLNNIGLLIIESTVLIVFVWYYSKLKPRVDHAFRRKKYDYYQVLGEIGQKIGSELNISIVIDRLFKELRDILYIRNGLMLVQQPGQLDYAEAGSIGYERLVGVEKKGVMSLSHQSPLCQWLNQNQRALEREQVAVDPQYAPIKEEAAAFLDQNALEVLIPVVMENKVNALVGIGKKENLQAYTVKDIELLEYMGRQIGITIDNALHHEDIIEKERLAEEMRLGQEIQMALLPRESPQVPGLIVQGMMQPAQEIGGDYYDFINFPEKGKLAIVIGDVSGKGVAAGLLMAMAKTAIHTLSQEDISPKQILLKTNQILHQHIGGQKFMTLLYLLWKPPHIDLAYSSAGHEHILIYRYQQRELESVKSGGFMLGMVLDIERFLEEKQLKLNKGDKILLYTDGVTEAENETKDRFGLPRLQDALKRHGDKSAQELMQAIKDEVYVFIGSHPQYDDITLVALEMV